LNGSRLAPCCEAAEAIPASHEMNANLLGIDIGTSSCKCIIVEPEGKIIAEATQEYKPIVDSTGLAEQNPEDWYQALLRGLSKLKEASHYGFQEVAAVGTTGQMRGPTFLNSARKPIRNSILWNDTRCTDEVLEIKHRAGDWVWGVNHNPITTMCTLPKLMWLNRHEPAVWREIDKVIYPKDFINLRLTDCVQTDLSDASGSSFYDFEKQSWSLEILKLFGIPESKLPAVVPSLTLVGSVTRAAAEETGLRQGIPLVAGGSDATIEMVALGISNKQQCKIRLGTSGAFSTIISSRDVAHISNKNIHFWSYILPDTAMVDINTRACAFSTEWMKDLSYKTESKLENIYEIMIAEASSASIGSDGLFYHPYLMGEDAPYWDTSLKASFVGITAAHQRPHFTRAVYEGTAYALRDAKAVLGDLGQNFREHIFVGGGTKNKLWVSIVADVLGIDGLIFRDMSASLGAAMLAGIGTKIFKNVEDANRRFRKSAEAVTYSRRNHELYEEPYNAYRRIKQAFDCIYHS
jgi:xylulokinase